MSAFHFRIKNPWALLPIVTFLGVIAIIIFVNYKNFTKPIVVIVGDSNSDPYSILQVQKWSQKYQVIHQDDQFIYNFAIGGHAVEDFDTPEIRQQLFQIAQDVHPGQPVILISLLGTNNAIMTNKLDDPELFIAHYAKLIDQFASIIHPQYIFIGSIPPVIVRRIPNNKTPTDPKAIALIPQFNVALQNWVSRQNAVNQSHWQFISVLPENVYQPEVADTYLISDGIHLNAKAQEEVLKKVSAALNQALLR